MQAISIIPGFLISTC